MLSPDNRDSTIFSWNIENYELQRELSFTELQMEWKAGNVPIREFDFKLTKFFQAFISEIKQRWNNIQYLRIY